MDRPIADILQNIGLEIYIDRLLQAGFDTLSSLNDVSEADFDKLNVKLGHRRRLQRELRRLAEERDDSRMNILYHQPPQVPAEKGRRRYRRRPRRDNNAPRKPLSAYASFANHLRAQAENKDLSFSDLAKHIGYQWQSISLQERTKWELDTASLKDKYSKALYSYKQTANYKKHKDYLDHFKSAKKASTTIQCPRDKETLSKCLNLDNNLPGNCQNPSISDSHTENDQQPWSQNPPSAREKSIGPDSEKIQGFDGQAAMISHVSMDILSLDRELLAPGHDIKPGHVNTDLEQLKNRMNVLNEVPELPRLSNNDRLGSVGVTPVSWCPYQKQPLLCDLFGNLQMTGSSSSFQDSSIIPNDEKCWGWILGSLRSTTSAPDTKPCHDQNPETVPGMVPGSKFDICRSLFPLKEDVLHHFSVSRTWTTVTSNMGLVEDIIALYFDREHASFPVLSKEPFLVDLRDGRNRYCSAALVNALLALGCRLYTLPGAFRGPIDRAATSDRFYVEAKILLARESAHRVTTIQTLSVMSILEANSGCERSGILYAKEAIRLAVNLSLPNNVDSQYRTNHEVIAATFLGAFALHLIWSLLTSCVPCTPTLPVSPDHERAEAHKWEPLMDDSVLRISNYVQSSKMQPVWKNLLKLSILINETLNVRHSPNNGGPGAEARTLYEKYLQWYAALPDDLRLGYTVDTGILFVHIYHYFAVLLLFQSYIGVNLPAFDSLLELPDLSVEDICAQASNTVVALVHNYDQLYDLYHGSTFLKYIVRHMVLQSFKRARLE